MRGEEATDHVVEVDAKLEVVLPGVPRLVVVEGRLHRRLGAEVRVL